MNEPVNTKNTRQKSTLILLFLVFAAPLIAAWIIYTFTDFGSDGINNSHGRLILPPGQVSNLEAVDPATDTDYPLHGKWNLVYLVSGVCDSECTRVLDIMQNTRAALGNDSYRLQLVLAVTENTMNNALGSRLSEMRIRVLEKTGITESLNNNNTGPQTLREDNLYLIDPLGNLMMHYTPDSTLPGIIKDLKRLLHNSRIG